MRCCERIEERRLGSVEVPARGGLPCLRARLGRARLLVCLRPDGGNEVYQVRGDGAVRVPAFVAEDLAAEAGPGAALYALCLAALERFGGARLLGPLCVSRGGAYYVVAGAIHPGNIAVTAWAGPAVDLAEIRRLARYAEPLLPGRGAAFAGDAGRVLALLGLGVSPLDGTTWCAYAGFVSGREPRGAWEEVSADAYEVRAYGAGTSPGECAAALGGVVGRWRP